ncbi:ChaN family lipoprotein [Marivivens donghaensis]|uniref:ChaN family lipoprotein n=1 Tax=Marivivens donghaensis TaxID=1699413 RepID=UPI003F69E218
MAAPAVAQDIHILGEVHDNPLHHIEQAKQIAAIAPSAIVFEMLAPDQAALVNSSDRHDPNLGAIIGWEAAGWPDFAIYAPIFAASDAPVYGAALPRDTVIAAITLSAAEVFGEGADRYGLNTISDDLRTAMEAEQAEAHCDALPAEMLPGMVEAQRLRDAHFARVTLTAYDETGGPVVVITGNGHARTDRAVPSYIASVRPDLTVHALGLLEAAEDDAPFDTVIVTAPAERDDPCAAFQ